MACEQTRTLLHGYLDGELDVVRSAEFERHLEGCPQCASELAAQEQLRGTWKAAQLYEKAPARLAQRVARQIDLVRREEMKATSMPLWPVWRRMAILASAAVLVAGVGAFLSFKAIRQNASPESAIVAEAIDAHLRALQPGHLTDVESTDQHTVKPWFDGKLDFVPPVRDEAENGFPLVGGRLDALGGRSVAALVYGRRKHLINVFVWPAADSEPEARAKGSRNGYQWMRWKSGGMEFCAVSDVSQDDLRELIELLQ